MLFNTLANVTHPHAFIDRGMSIFDFATWKYLEGFNFYSLVVTIVGTSVACFTMTCRHFIHPAFIQLPTSRSVLKFAPVGNG